MEKSYTVYCHTTPSNKRYFGITCAKVEARWSNGRGYETCPAFKKAIEKYGWDKIEHEILYAGLTKEEAEAEERRLIAEYRTTNRKYGYNILPGGNIGSCKDVPREVRDKATKERTKVGRAQTQESIDKALATKRDRGIIEPVFCYETGQSYLSMSDAARSIGLNSTVSISLAVKNPSCTAAGNHWCYLKDVDGFEPKPKSVLRPVINLETQKRYESLVAASLDTGADVPGIILTCEGKRRRTNGLTFCYEEDYDSFVPQEEFKRQKPVRNIATGVVFESAAAASRAYGYSDNSIARVCKGERKSIHGDRWEYVNPEDVQPNKTFDYKRHENSAKAHSVINVETGEIYQSVSEAARVTGIQRRGIGMCCKIETYTAGGFHWRYINDEVQNK